MSSNLFMLGKRSCISFLTPRLIPTGTTFMLLQDGDSEKNDGSAGPPASRWDAQEWRLASRQCVYFEQNHWTIKSQSCHHLRQNHRHNSQFFNLFIYFYLLVTKFNFLRLRVVAEQHTPLDVVQVHLERQNWRRFISSTRRRDALTFKAAP